MVRADFAENLLSLGFRNTALLMAGVIAFAHVRGGGEYGENCEQGEQPERGIPKVPFNFQHDRPRGSFGVPPTAKL